MGRFKATNYVIGTPGDPVTINAGQYAESAPIPLGGVDELEVGGGGAFGATPDGNIQIDIFSAEEDGAPFTTEARATMQLAYQADTAKRDSLPVNSNPKYVKVRISNNDTADSVTAYAYATKTWQP